MNTNIEDVLKFVGKYKNDGSTFLLDNNGSYAIIRRNRAGIVSRLDINQNLAFTLQDCFGIKLYYSMPKL